MHCIYAELTLGFSDGESGLDVFFANVTKTLAPGHIDWVLFLIVEIGDKNGISFGNWHTSFGLSGIVLGVNVRMGKKREDVDTVRAFLLQFIAFR